MGRVDEEIDRSIKDVDGIKGKMNESLYNSKRVSTVDASIWMMIAVRPSCLYCSYAV